MEFVKKKGKKLRRNRDLVKTGSTTAAEVNSAKHLGGVWKRERPQLVHGLQRKKGETGKSKLYISGREKEMGFRKTSLLAECLGEKKKWGAGFSYKRDEGGLVFTR